MTTTSPEALREAVERAEAWARIIERPAPDGDNSLKVAASVAEQHARDLRALLSALQEAREADARVATFLIEQQDEPSFWDTTNSGLHARVNYWRNKCIEAGRQLDPKRWGPTDAAEVRALSPGGADE